VDHGDFGGEVEGNRSIGEVLDYVDPLPLAAAAAAASAAPAALDAVR